MNNKLIQVSLAAIVVLLAVQVGFQISVKVTDAVRAANPAPLTKEQVSHQEYLKYFLDETTKRQDTYKTDIYDNAAVTTIYQQQLITLEYIFHELNAQTILMVQEQMEK